MQAFSIFIYNRIYFILFSNTSAKTMKSEIIIQTFVYFNFKFLIKLYVYIAAKFKICMFLHTYFHS